MTACPPNALRQATHPGGSGNLFALHCRGCALRNALEEGALHITVESLIGLSRCPIYRGLSGQLTTTQARLRPNRSEKATERMSSCSSSGSSVSGADPPDLLSVRSGGSVGVLPFAFSAELCEAAGFAADGV